MNTEDVLVVSASKIIGNLWDSELTLIVIGSIGAVTRLIAPFLNHKSLDPAVIVMDCESMNVVPILGAHKAGAEQLAIELAEDLTLTVPIVA